MVAIEQVTYRQLYLDTLSLSELAAIYVMSIFYEVNCFE